ncbi:MAG: glucose-6-phosphate dehydrogenase [Sphingomonadaceae bacterium]
MDTLPKANETIPNLLRAGSPEQRVAPSCAIVIFGASGDLTSRKLVPALYNLALANLLPAEFAIIGVARRPLDTGVFREKLRDAAERFSRTAPLNPVLWESFAGRISYLSGDLSDPATYEQLRKRLAEIDAQQGTAGNRLYYLATPPSFFPTIVQRLGEAGLNRGGRPEAFARIIVEKPFGRDLASALALNRQIWQAFDESQLYRIDHYLGKETVQNILAFRFANRLWEPVWNSEHVDHVQITVAESIGIEGRGAYYEEAGAFRDMVENHMLQLLALVTMEPPINFTSDAVRDESGKVLKALRPLSRDEVAQATVRGRYEAGWIDGRPVPAYRDEPNVAPDSTTESFVALRLFIDNWRWAGTPFYLRHGKRMPSRLTEIAVQFKPAPHLPFASSDTAALEPNVLVLRLQPDEGITLRFGAKVPGMAMRIRSVNMDFLYGSSFLLPSPDAYERLLLDSLLGDHTLFTRADAVEAGWRFATPILEAWQAMGSPPEPYPAGSWGPRAANELLARDGRRWRRR